MISVPCNKVSQSKEDKLTSCYEYIQRGSPIKETRKTLKYLEERKNDRITRKHLNYYSSGLSMQTRAEKNVKNIAG